MKNGECACSAPLWSFNFLSKLMQAANCVRFCLNLFCREVHKGCLPHNKNDSDKTVHNLLLISAWIKLEIHVPEQSATFSFLHYFTG